MGKFAQSEQPVAKVDRCAIGTLLESTDIDDDDREAILTNLHEVSSPAFAAWLGSLGVESTYSTAKRHRRGECCPGLKIGR